MADYTPLYSPGDAFSSVASAAVTGGQLVETTTTGAVGPAGAASVKVVGVAAFDAGIGQPVMVHSLDQVHYLTAAGTVTVGDLVQAGASGTGQTGATLNTVIGVALTTATTGNKFACVGR